ncbi:MAG: hypothetical protein WCI88_12400 [Chloroflexota bacterium]|jgi:hypothetical protein
MNLTIELSERGVRDGVSLIAAYHFLLAVASLLGTLAIIVYSIFPIWSGAANGSIQNLFLPFLGTVTGAMLTIAYLITGIGLLRFKNSARMWGIFLALFGVIAGLFSVIGGIASGFSMLPDNGLQLGMIGLSLICAYAILVLLDIIILVFLLNMQVRSVFYGQEWLLTATESLGRERK